METLLDDQTKAIEKLRSYKVGALFMEPGTGKTRTAYELVRSVDGCDYILWLTPFQTKDNLRQELYKWGATGIRIEGIESLSSSDRIFLELQRELHAASRPFIVVDESLKIKNWDAIRTKRIIELGRVAEYKLILNGTPLSRNILDLWAQMDFLSPKILNMSMAEFKSTFCEWKKITKRIGNIVKTKEWITKFHNVDHLYSIIRHYVYECDLELDLRKQYIVMPYEIEQDIKDEYSELKTKYLDSEMMQWKNNNIFLEMTQKMQHLYCCTEDKFNRLSEILKANDSNKVIVFTKYISSREAIQQKYPDLTVLSYGKHTYGLNLQHKSVTVYWDKTWDFAQREQTERRTYRTGQIQDCIYYDLTGNVGLETMIDKNVQRKENLLEYFKQISVEQIKKEL
jgi:SNF2 family DNA or RNA helicase